MQISISNKRLKELASMSGEGCGCLSDAIKESAEMARFILALQEQEPVAMVGTGSSNLSVVKLDNAPEGTFLYPRLTPAIQDNRSLASEASEAWTNYPGFVSS